LEEAVSTDLIDSVHTIEVKGIRVDFGGVRALDGVDLMFREHEVAGLIGPNGAGKTTMLNVLSGFVRPTAGRIVMAGTDITGWPPSRLARTGVARTFQNVRLFGELTVLENVQVGALGVGVRGSEAVRSAQSLLEFVGLADVAQRKAHTLPYGAERLLGLARVLATQPKWLLLDEPAAGLNESETDHLGEILKSIRRQFNCAMVLVEHNMRLVMQLCDRLHVLDHGQILMVGVPKVVAANPTVRAAYFGKSSRQATPFS